MIGNDVGASWSDLGSNSAGNVVVGANSATSVTANAQNNTFIGYQAATSVLTPTSCIAIGASAGSNWTSNENDNISIGFPGVAAETNTIHLGGNNVYTKAFIGGINGVTSSNALMVTIDSVTDQLGVATIPGGGGVTLTGDSGSATGSSIAFNGQPQGGGSVTFSASGSTVLLNTTDASSNTSIGLGAGTGLLANGGGSCTVIGHNAMPLPTANLDDVVIGDTAFAATNYLASGSSGNVIIGQGALRFATDDYYKWHKLRDKEFIWGLFYTN